MKKIDELKVKIAAYESGLPILKTVNATTQIKEQTDIINSLKAELKALQRPDKIAKLL